MATAWSTIKSEIQGILKDADFISGGTNESYLLTYANDAQLKICELLDIRRMLKTATISCTTSNYRYNMPADFLKIGPETRAYVDGYDYWIKQVSKEEINYVDPNHSSTTSAVTPDLVCIDGSEVLIYPMWTGTLTIQDYFREPTLMTVDGSTPDILLQGIDVDRIVKDMIVDYVCYVVYSKWLKRMDDAEIHMNSFMGAISQAKRNNPTTALNDFVEGAYG